MILGALKIFVPSWIGKSNSSLNSDSIGTYQHSSNLSITRLKDKVDSSVILLISELKSLITNVDANSMNEVIVRKSYKMKKSNENNSKNEVSSIMKMITGKKLLFSFVARPTILLVPAIANGLIVINRKPEMSGKTTNLLL